MSQSAIGRLRRLLPPPQFGGDIVDWDHLAGVMGLGLPTDYKEFVELYGGGEIDEYLSVSMLPVQRSPYGDLLDGMNPSLPPEFRGELSSCFSSAAPPRLLPFDATASSDVVFWVIDGVPDTWKVVVFRRQSPHGARGWTIFDGSITEFLCALSNGALQPFSQQLSEGELHRYLGWRDN
jgi:hypothetical protein